MVNRGFSNTLQKKLKYQVNFGATVSILPEKVKDNLLRILARIVIFTNLKATNYNAAYQ